MINKDTVSTPELSYLGDAVIELLVRERLIEKGVRGSGELNSEARAYITAGAQAKAAARILDLLDEKEEGVYRRARNSHTGHVPKSAQIAEYRAATALEALFGYLKIENREERMRELFLVAYPENKENNEV